MVRSVFFAFANVIGGRGNSRNIVIKHGVKSPSNQFEICGTLGGPLPIAQNSGLYNQDKPVRVCQNANRSVQTCSGSEKRLQN